MLLTPKIEQAIVRSAILHKDQKRKVSGIPYIIHPYTVAFMLAQHTADEDIIAAGLLHDVLEDVAHYSAQDLTEEFGERVCRIVREVSEEYTFEERMNHSLRKNGNWQGRKAQYLVALACDSEEALLVAAADKLHNLHSFLNDYRVYGDQVWHSLGSTSEQMVWFYGEVTRIIGGRLEHPLVSELQATFFDFSRLIMAERKHH